MRGHSLTLSRQESPEPSILCSFHSTTLASGAFPARAEEAPGSVCHVRTWVFWLPYPSDYLSEGHVRGWLEGELEGWVGKSGVCVRRPLEFGDWGLEGCGGLPRPMAVSPFLRMRLLSSWSSCSSRDPCAWGLLFEGGPGGGSGGLCSGPRPPALGKGGLSKDLWLMRGVSGLAVFSLIVEKEVEVSLVSSGKAPTSSYTGSS